uniref:Uncharacterized protein n=1 Tax=Anguilla anguilla TaxID=7936 RepID=A0A0E9TLF1_ANGAN
MKSLFLQMNRLY